ncbi:MAG: ATP phosphoribosyltransferase regulatory subunit [Gammaproteobacteria bacterium]|nr:ATP phosphoribosyltransferase regulatory subunit [Gammaproteobacteria bacterium]
MKGYLDDLNIEYDEDPFLVRGLDYYTRTAFELESPGSRRTECAGGRWPLRSAGTGDWQQQPVPAIGFAAGLERLFLALDASDTELPASPRPDVFIAALGDEAQSAGSSAMPRSCAAKA